MLESYKTMDINMLLSIVNMKLRNEGEDLDGFCRRYQIDPALLIARLSEKQLSYDPTHNQFKQNT